MSVQRDVLRNFPVVIYAGTDVESLAQLVTRNQPVAIRVVTLQRYHVIQLLRLIHVRRCAEVSSAVVIAAQGNVEIATHRECILFVLLKSDCVATAVIP